MGSVVTSSFTINALVKNHENIIYNASRSFSASNTNFISASNIIIGSASYNTSNRAFDGNLNEFRYWSYTLNNASMVEYTKNPLFYGGNSDSDAYDYLNFRLPLSYLITTTGSYLSVHPNQSLPSFSGSISSSAIFSGFVDGDLTGEDYTTYVSIPSLGSDNIYSSKIRNINTSLIRPLDPDISAELLTKDQTPKDSNLVGIYMSPAETIDSDIYNQLGSFSIDDYIGDPADQNLSYYSALRVIQNQYWKKYKNSNSFSALFRLLSVYDYSFFDQLKQLLPARVQVNSGIVVKQNILERSKFTIVDDVVASRPMYEDTINVRNNIITSGDYPVYNGTVTQSNLYQPGQYNYSSSRLISGTGVVSYMVRFEPTGAVILQNSLSNTKQIFYPIYSTEDSASANIYNSSSSYRAAEVQDYEFEGIATRRMKYEGTRISSPGYNIASLDLLDNSPVISVITLGPNGGRTIRKNPAIPPILPPAPQNPVVNTTNPSSALRVNVRYSAGIGFNIL